MRRTVSETRCVGDRGWRAKGFPEPRPLYRLPELLARPGASILVTEGRRSINERSPLALDLYAWLSYEAFRAHKRQGPVRRLETARAFSQHFLLSFLRQFFVWE